MPRRHIGRPQPDVENVAQLERLLPERLRIDQVVVNGCGVVHQQVQPAAFVLRPARTTRQPRRRHCGRRPPRCRRPRGRSPFCRSGTPANRRQRAPRRYRVLRRDSPPSRPPPALQCPSRDTKLRRHPHRFVDHRQIPVADRVDNRVGQRRTGQEQPAAGCAARCSASRRSRQRADASAFHCTLV